MGASRYDAGRYEAGRYEAGGIAARRRVLARVPAWAKGVLAGLAGAVIGLATADVRLLAALLGLTLLGWMMVASLERIENWIVIYLFALVLLPQLTVGGIPVQLGDFMFAVGFVIFLKRLSYVRSSLMLAASFLFMCSVFVSVIGVFRFNTGMGVFSFMNAVRLLEVIFPVFLLSTYRRIDYARITRLFIVFGAISCLLGVLQFMLQIPVDPKTVWIGSQKFYRASGIFMEANSYGHFSAALSLMLSVLYIEGRNRLDGRQRLGVLVSLLLAMSACLLTFSRGALALYAGGILIYALLTRKGSVLVRMLLLILVPLGGLWLADPQVFALFLNRMSMTVMNMFTDFDSISGGRVDSWAIAADVFRTHPLVGVGYKNIDAYLLYFFGFEVVGDNNYITILVELGVLGFIGFLLLTVAMLVLLARDAGMPDRLVQQVLLAVWLATLLQMAVLDSFTFWRSLTLVFIYIGIVLSYKLHTREVET